MRAMPLHAEAAEFHGTPCIRLRSGDATALVALHGGHVLSWVPADGRERLFLSARAQYGTSQAIRGGVPVIFPQFAARGALPKHGFARTLPWRFLDLGEHATFELRSSAATAVWPHAFVVRLQIGLDATALTLTLTLAIENEGAEAFAFTAALHTYLAVDDIAAASVLGLDGCRYEDNADGGAVAQQRGEVRFNGEVDRIYAASAQAITQSRRLELRDGAHALSIAQEGFTDTVVWNPGATLAAGIGDLAPDDYRRFVCVEAGQVLQPVVLAPGERWIGRQRLG
ncbi:D-hexose-6-phosphate mutarotase [Lysobacter terrae]